MYMFIALRSIVWAKNNNNKREGDATWGVLKEQIKKSIENPETKIEIDWLINWL